MLGPLLFLLFINDMDETITNGTLRHFTDDTNLSYYTPKWLIRTIYYSLFDSHMIFGCRIWGKHKTNLVKRVVKLQEKAIRIISFKDNNVQVSNLFAQSKI